MAEHYVKKSMKIEVYEYSMLSSRILDFDVGYCMHLIYYLVYGRLASAPYIESMINSKRFKNRRTKIMKTTKSTR